MIISKFADDTKLSHQQEDHHHIQEALDKLVVWADTWGMAFNTAKYKVLHIGRNNTEHVYNIRGLISQLLIMELILELLPKKTCDLDYNVKRQQKKPELFLARSHGLSPIETGIFL